MRLLVGAAALVAGCYSPTYSVGSACTTECPGDLICVDGFCRERGYVPPDAMVDAMVDAAPPVDTDGDSLFDDEDNCTELANPDQHDEDDDAIGDVCDPCPHLAGTAADGDGDGVGDACDPQLAVAKESIKFFDPFTTTRAEWNYGTNYDVMGEQLRSDGNVGNAILTIGTTDVRVITGGTVQAVGGSPRQLSIKLGFSDGGADYLYGDIYDNGSNTGISAASADSGTYTTLAGPTGPSSSLPTGAFTMQFDAAVSTQQLAVEATLGGVSYASQTGMATTPALVAGNAIYIYSRNVSWRFDYFLVIETAP